MGSTRSAEKRSELRITPISRVSGAGKKFLSARVSSSYYFVIYARLSPTASVNEILAALVISIYLT